MQLTLILLGRRISTSARSHLHSYITLHQLGATLNIKDTLRGLYRSYFFIITI
jgi:hypothetical protein